MTDDRDETSSGTDLIEHAPDWEAILNGALTDMMFGNDTALSSVSGLHFDPIHAAFEALLFGGDEAGPAECDAAHVHVWVANDAFAPAGFGRIMLTRGIQAAATDHLAGVLDEDSPQINANAAIASGHAANDNSLWIGREDNAYGRDPSVATLDNGDALIAWIGTDHAVHARFLPASGDGDIAASADRGKLDQLLAGLGDAAAEGKAGRVVVTAIAQNSFAALWTYEFALNSVLMGQILTLASPAHGDEESRGTHWAVQDIEPHVAPQNGGAFSVAVVDSGALTVTFDGAGEDGTADVKMVRWHAPGAQGVQTAGGDDAQTSNHATPPLNLIDDDLRDGATGDPADIVTADISSANTRNTASGATSHHAETNSGEIAVIASLAIAGDANDTVEQTTPSLAVSDNGSPTAMYIVPGASGDATGQVIIAALDEHGHARTAPVIVTTSALVSDGDHPALDVGPAITGTHDGVAVVWIEESGDGAGAAKLLQVQAYDDDSKPLSDTPLTVASSEDSGASYSDLATGYTHNDDDDDSAEDGDGSGILAVAWVENASDDGYGTIKAQLYSATGDGDSGESNALTALSDSSVTYGDGADRAPQIEGLGSGALAIAWVEEGEHGAPDVVRGVITTPGGETADTDLDLSQFMPQGVADGTSPVLASDEDGDLIVGWIQMALTGGYEAASAIYKHSDKGHWTPPSAAQILNHFEEIPHDFAIAVSTDDGDMSLVVAWRDEDNNVTALRYDVEESKAGPEFTVNTDSDHNDGAGIGLSALSDGQLLLVYSSNDGQDSDISGALLSISDDHSGSNSGTGSTSSDISKALTADLSAPAENSSTETSETHYGAVATSDVDASSCDSGGAAVVDFAADVIMFTAPESASAAPTDHSATSATELVTSAACDAAVPTLQDMAALEALAKPEHDDDQKDKDSSKSGDSDSDCSSSSSSGKGGSGSADQDASWGGDSVDDSHSGSGPSANDNSPSHQGGEVIAFANGYGNDCADYTTPDEQAALVPEPISALFEALQFANAFCDTGNGDVLVFDGSNVATISQLKLPDQNSQHYDVPLV